MNNFAQDYSGYLLTEAKNKEFEDIFKLFEIDKELPFYIKFNKILVKPFSYKRKILKSKDNKKEIINIRTFAIDKLRIEDAKFIIILSRFLIDENDILYLQRRLSQIKHEIDHKVDDISDIINDSIRNSQDDLIKTINKISEDIKKYTKNFSDTGKFLAGLLKPDITCFIVIEFFNELLVDFAKPKIDKKNASKNLQIELNKIIPENIPSSINSDKNRLKEIFINLIRNSIKFTSQGYINFGIKKYDEESHKFEYFVQDTGKGIEEELLKNIKQFFKSGLLKDYPYKLKEHFGLRIVKENIDVLGGVLEIDSKVDMGTTITFSVPDLKIDKE